jgi:hypothetical protein
MIGSVHRHGLDMHNYQADVSMKLWLLNTPKAVNEVTISTCLHHYINCVYVQLLPVM